jgi:tetratricopeptide (TPR) repeat protein
MASRHFDELELDSIPFDPNSADEYAAPISDLQQQVMEKVTQGFRAQEEGTYDVAIVRYDQALEHDNIPFQVICFIHSNLSRCHQITGDRIRAIEHAEAHVQVLKIAASQNQLGGAGDRLMAAAYNDLGLACYSQGNYERALLEFELAVAYSSRRGSDPKLLIRSQGNLGNALACQGKFKQAFAHHSEQLRLAEATLAPNDPERAEMLKKAAFNLQSDCNSLAKYEKASQYERHVKSATSGRPMSQDMDELPLAASATPSLVNDTVGDGSLSRKQLHHGWVCKHKGGKFLEPTRLTHKKRWAALTNGIFMYNNTAAVSKPARCIRVEHITDVYTTQLHEDEKALGLARSFKLFTGTRTYYFTCSSEREASAWVQAIARARTDRAQFARMTTVQRTRGAASLAFGGTSSAHARANQQQDAYMDGEDMAMTMSTFDAVPYGFADKENVENPLYNSMLGTLWVTHACAVGVN